MDTRTERIAHAIKESGHTPATIAPKLGCSSAAVYQWVSGSTKDIKNDLLFTLADVTGFEARWIATGEGPARRQETERERMLIEHYRASDEQARRVIDRVAQEIAPYHGPGGGESDEPAKPRMRA